MFLYISVSRAIAFFYFVRGLWDRKRQLLEAVRCLLFLNKVTDLLVSHPGHRHLKKIQSGQLDLVICLSRRQISLLIWLSFISSYVWPARTTNQSSRPDSVSLRYLLVKFKAIFSYKCMLPLFIFYFTSTSLTAEAPTFKILTVFLMPGSSFKKSSVSCSVCAHSHDWSQNNIYIFYIYIYTIKMYPTCPTWCEIQQD